MELLEGMQGWFDVTLDLLYEQWLSGDYEKLSDCPVYKEAVTFRDAINYYIKANYPEESYYELKHKNIKYELNKRIQAKRRSNIKRMFE